MPTPHPGRPGAAALILAGGLLAAAAALAQDTGARPASTGDVAIDNSGDYRQEVQACRSGRTAQDTATCLQEARNAQAERRRGGLTAPESLQANALARCNVFRTDEDKRACEARVMGQGETSGSVAGGGILHEYAYEVPAPQDLQQGGAMGAGPASSSGASPSTGPAPDPMEEEMEEDEGEDDAE